MLKFRKQISFLIAAVMTVCLSVGILLLVPHKTANAIEINSGNKGTYLNISGTTLNGLSEDGEKALGTNSFDLVVPKEIVTISGSAFSGTNISSLTFESGSAFKTISNGSNSGNVNNHVPESADYGAFSNCKVLSKVELPDSTETIGSYAFYGCANLAEIVIPKNVTTVGNGVFAECTYLNSVTYSGEKVTAVRNATFYNCNYLKEADLPSSITAIGELAFYNCRMLTKLDLRNVTNVARGGTDPYAPFNGCDRLAEIHIRNSVTQQAYFGSITNQATVDTTKIVRRYSDNRNILGFLFANVFNVVYYNASGNIVNNSKSYYVNKDGYIFVKNTGWATTSYTGDAGMTLSNLNNVLATSTTNYLATSLNPASSGQDQLTTTWNESYVDGAWYLIGYNGSEGYSQSFMEFPAEFTSGSETVDKYYINVGAFVFEHANHVKLPSSVLGIGDRAFSSSGNEVFDMSALGPDAFIGKQYRTSVGAGGVIYLPSEPIRIGHGSSNGAVPTHVIAPDRKSYLNWANTNNNFCYYCSFTSELTYLVPINLHYPTAENADNVDKEYRLSGKAYNYIPNWNNGKWTTDDSVTLPVQKGYGTSVWYNNASYTTVMTSGTINALLVSDNHSTSEINLYARTVLRPDGSMPNGEEVTLTASYIYNGTEYGMDELNQKADGTDGLLSVAGNGLQLYDGSVATITDYQPIYGIATTIPKSVTNAGTYTIRISLPGVLEGIDYGEWSAPVYIKLSVDQQAINLADGADENGNALKYFSFGTDSGITLTQGRINVDEHGVPTRDDVNGQYPAYNSVINSTGSEIELLINIRTGVQSFSVEEAGIVNNKGTDPGVYENTQFVLQTVSTNYRFKDVTEQQAKILSDYYGITVSVTSNVGETVRISKIWYIIGSNNWFVVGETTDRYSVFNRTGSSAREVTFGFVEDFGTGNSNVNVPGTHRTQAGEIVTFTLKVSGNGNISNQVITNEKVDAQLIRDYVNSSMPVGSYELTLYYPPVLGTETEAYCQELQETYNFTVKNASFESLTPVKTVIDSLTAIPDDYELEFTEDVQFFDGDLAAQIAVLKDVYTGVARKGVWEGSTYDSCYGNIEIEFNLNRIGNNGYYEPDVVKQYFTKPDTYTIYWYIFATNYEPTVNISTEARRDYSYSVTMYKLVEPLSKRDDVVYTGNKVVPTVNTTDEYRIIWSTDENAYINVGTHKFWLQLNDSEHYRWGYVNEGGEKVYSTENLEVTFDIVPAKNRWLSFPAIEGWEYDGEPNAAPSGVALYGDVTFTFYKENGEKIEMDDLVNAGSYIMRAEVETGENSNWESIFEDISFTVRKKVVTAPTIAPVEYNGKKQDAKIDGDYYTVIGNDGFTDVDNYPITIIIDDNHAWPSDTPGVEEGNKLTLIFQITNIQNRFEAPFAVTGWTWNSYNDDEAIVFNAKPKVYTHITEDENIWASAVKWFIYDKVEATGEALISFNLDKDGKVSDKEVLDKLNALLAGTYYARATIDGDAKGNLDAFTDVTQFVVTERVNTWTATPAMFSWAYNSFESSFLSAGVPVAGTVKYTVCSDEACERVVGNLKDFTFNSEGELSEEVVNELKGLITGDYYLLAVVDKVTGQYDGLRLGGRGTSFQVTEADNDWVTAPAISSWVLGEWKPQYNTPEAEALFGDVELTITKDGVTYYRATWVKGAENPTVQENVFKENALEGIPVGAYTLTAKASGIANRYKSIEKDVTFEIYSSGDKMPPNSWSISPTIESWTAGDEPNEPYGVSLREVGNDVYHATYYERFKNEETGKFDTKPLDGVPSQPGDYLVIYEAYVYGHRDYLKAELTFSIYPRINRWTKTPAIKDWFMNETPSDPVAETSETGTKDITYLYKAKDASDDAYTDVKPTTAGTYIMKVTATAAHCEDLIERVEFRIMLAANKWVKDPILDGWSEEFSPNDPDAVAEHGKVVYTYWTTKYNAEANRYERDTLIKDGDKDGKPTAEGTYIMVATAEADGYDTLEAEVVFTIEPAWDMTLMVIDMVLAIVAVIATVVVIAIVIRRKNKC